MDGGSETVAGPGRGDLGCARARAPAHPCGQPGAVLSRWITGLGPGSFAMVMATGIVSVAMLEESPAASAVLAIVAGAAWLLLLVLSGARLVWLGARVRAELAGPATWADFFTVVAATEVLGARAWIAGLDGIASMLWAVGALAWLLLAVSVPLAVGVRRGRVVWWAASGNWLLPVVATQSLAALAGSLVADGRPWVLLLVSMGGWVLGLALYAALVAAIGLRVLSVHHPPARFTPDDWIVMGALAISALTASSLLRAEPAARLPTLVHTLLAGGGAACWAIATAALPALSVLQVGQLRRDPSARRYQARWWAAVFPLGMYGVTTHQLAVVLRWGHLEPVARAAAWVAAAAWTTVAASGIVVSARRGRVAGGVGTSGCDLDGR